MKFLAVFGLRCEGNLTDFDNHSDRVLDELMEMSEVIDPDVAVKLATGEVDVQLIIEARDQLDAAAKAACALRTAIHAAGGSTPGWEAWISAAVNSQVREVELVEA